MSLSREKVKLVHGIGKFPCPSVPCCKHRDSGWFLYYDEDGYEFFFECDYNEDHDFTIDGKWGDESPIGDMRLEVQKMKNEQYNSTNGK